MMKSKITLEIGTDFSEVLQDGDDITKYVEEKFHSAMHDVIEDFMTGDEIEPWVLNKMDEDLPKGVDEFCKLGNIALTLTDNEIIMPFVAPDNAKLPKQLPKEQKTLVGLMFGDKE